MLVAQLGGLKPIAQVRLVLSTSNQRMPCDSAQWPHAVVDASRAQAALRNLESAASARGGQGFTMFS